MYTSKGIIAVANMTLKIILMPKNLNLPKIYPAMADVVTIEIVDNKANDTLFQIQ